MNDIIIDLCCGLGGASQAMKDRGWKVISVDIERKFKPDIVADVRLLTLKNIQPLLVWASPPCGEFAREWMPWTKTGEKPDMSIVKACYEIILEIKPIFWCIENVQGAVKYFKPLLGKPRAIHKPYFLWGNFPNNWKIKITYEISLAIAMSIEANLELF